MSDTAYIDQLLKAQQQATQIIEKAQQQRQRKLKQAREDAQAEISKFRKQEQSKFQSLKAQQTDKIFEDRLERETQEEIAKIKQDYEQNKQKVIKMLVQKVLQVDLTVPNSVKQKFLKKK